MHKFFLTMMMLLLLPGLYAQEGDSLSFGHGREGLEELADHLMEADNKERTRVSNLLKPEWEDYLEVFTDTAYARKLYRYHNRIWRQRLVVVKPLIKSQTMYQIWEARGTELKAYEGDAQYFPGGYHEMADLLVQDQVYYRLKYIKPGRRLGSAYDMIVYLDGHWRLFPRPWVLLF